MLLSTSALLLQLLASGKPQDGARALRMAHAAQQRFESRRRMHLPVEWNGGSGGGRCDVRVGRFCYWYDSTESRAVPEPRSIVSARTQLLATLDSAAAHSPTDGWIAGQRVRYLIEAGRLDDAAGAARACMAERWWCSALAGLALQVAERFAAADTAFSLALASMPAARRCEWQDVSVLAPPAVARRLRRLDCGERARIGERLLTLGQPLWATSVNDLRTEFFARHTMALLLAQSANAQGMSWGADSRELLLRYGWPEWFTRREPVGLYSSAVITGHDREPSYAALPAVQWFDRWPRLTEDSWRPYDPFAESRYSPRGVGRLGALAHQLARFPRGDSTLLVAVSGPAIPPDSALANDSSIIYLTGFANNGLIRSAGVQGPVTLRVPNDTLVASIELLGARSRHAARARYTVYPLPHAGRAVLSDLLLFDPARASGEDLDGVLRAALTGPRVSARDGLGVYWEVHGFPAKPSAAAAPAAAPARLSVSVEPVRLSITRRVATVLRLANAPAPVRLRWEAMIASGEPQHVTLRLPERARGAYRVVLTVQPPESAELTASREIEVVP